ncbi:hypothetical protein [Nitrosomonas ureae]|uniref:hypothetical protein n=1 Tax=Nitrosomonas ureae TaxID=44577 RepID=UPI0021AC3FC0|nr:hypothetical protein [Nitrosomonas ureae]
MPRITWASFSKLLPEMRITPIPPHPGGVAMAAMISGLTMYQLPNPGVEKLPALPLRY